MPEERGEAEVEQPERAGGQTGAVGVARDPADGDLDVALGDGIEGGLEVEGADPVALGVSGVAELTPGTDVQRGTNLLRGGTSLEQSDDSSAAAMPSGKPSAWR